MRRFVLVAVPLVACASATSPTERPVEVTLAKAEGAPTRAAEPAAREPVADASETLDACLARAADDAIEREPDGAAASVYARARSAHRAGRLDEARRAYFELIQRHPQSPLVPFAYWSFGEMFREEAKGDPTKLPFARQSYEEVLKYPASGLERATQTRLGEVLRASEEPERALGAVAKALRRIEKNDAGACAEPARGAAIDQLIAIYPTIGSPAKAEAFVHRFADDNDQMVIIMIRLAEAYARVGSAEHALTALTPALQRSSALSPELCLRGTQVVEAGAAAGARNAREARAALDRACQGH